MAANNGNISENNRSVIHQHRRGALRENHVARNILKIKRRHREKAGVISGQRGGSVMAPKRHGLMA